MNSLSPTRLPWDQRQRLMLLEARVIWDGLIRAGDLRDAFDISTRKAEKDIALYRARCPDNLDLDVATGVYRASDRFEPAFLRGSAEEWLSVLRHLELPQREFDVRVLQRLGTAIREQRWLSIEYQSMNRPDPRALQIAPHSLAYVGRWHARAYSLEHQGFRDFLLSRIIGLPGLGDSAGIDSAQDWDWRNHVTVRVGPHPGLTEPQRRVVEHDFGMHHGTLEKHLRLALVPYWLKLMNVGRSDIERHAAEQQIVLLNQAELDAFNRLG